MRAVLLRFLLPSIMIADIAAAEPAQRAAPASPALAAKEFYSELISRKVSGLPQGDAWAALMPRMTGSLTAAMQAARKQQADFMKKEPNEKPPWIEGDLFSSLFEGPQQFVLGKARISADRASVPVAFTYTDRGETSRWTDTLQLRKSGKAWLVDDVKYGGDWAFGNKGTLQDALAPEPSRVSPDGRFEFVTFSVEENNAGKPPFGIMERATQTLVWSPLDDLGDASRPEESVLWSPDSKRFALVTRVSTRRLGTFFFGSDGKTFVPLPWKDTGRLESLADAQVEAAGRKQGFSKSARLGQVISDNVLPVRWMNAETVVVTRAMERSISEKDKEDSTASGTARVLLRWNTKSSTFSITSD